MSGETEAKAAGITIQLTEFEWETLERAAARSGTTPEGFVRAAALAAVRMLPSPARAQSKRGQLTRERLASITWPANVDDVTTVLGGTRAKALYWLSFMARTGQLVRLVTGVYTTPGGPMEVPPDARTGAPPVRYADADWRLTNREIADRLGVTVNSVWQARQRHSPQPDDKARRVYRSEVVALIDAGLTVADTAARLGVSRKSVRAHLSRIRQGRGLPTGTQKRTDPKVGRDYVDQLVALAQAGKPWPTARETTAATGAHEVTVFSWRKRARKRLAQLGGPDPILHAATTRRVDVPAPEKSGRAETPPPTPTALSRSGLSRAERQRIWDAVDWSLRDIDIARQLGVDPSAVGVQRRRRGAQPTLGAEGVMRDTVIRLTLAGQTADAIATRFGLAKSTVQRHLREARKAGVVPLPAPTGQMRAEVARLRAEGLPNTQIATLLGLSVEAVRYHVRRLNAEARDET